MKIKLTTKMTMMFLFLIMSSYLLGSPLIIDVSHVYYTEGDISVTLIPRVGNEFQDEYSSTVWCCGTQQLSFDPPPCTNNYCWIRIQQGDREVIDPDAFINPSGQTTHLYMDLGKIPNFQHRQESK